MNDRPSYPWSEGDALFASELNAAIANMGVPLDGSPVTFTGPLIYTATGGNIARSAQDRSAEVLYAEDYGVVPNATDNTAGMLAFFAAVNARHNGVKAVLPSGTIRVTAPLLMHDFQYWSLEGAGMTATTLLYTGVDPTVDILSFTNCANFQLRGFGIDSTTTMTAGSAFHLTNAAHVFMDGLQAAGQYGLTHVGPDSNLHMNLWNGFWFDKVDMNTLINFEAMAQNDCVRVNGAVGSGAKADLFLQFGKTGFGLRGLHCGGAFGGLFVDACDIISSWNNVVIDQALAAERNREIMFGPNLACDSSGRVATPTAIGPTAPGGGAVGDNIIVNDVAGGYLVIKGWVSFQPVASGGSNVHVINWAGSVKLDGCIIANGAVDGIRIDTATPAIIISPGTQFDANIGYGINQTVAAPAVQGAPVFTRTGLGRISPATQLQLQSYPLALPVQAHVAAAGTTQADAAPIAGSYIKVETAIAGSGVILAITPAGTKTEILNTSTASVTVYPPVGWSFYGTGTNTPHILHQNNNMALISDGNAQYIYSSSGPMSLARIPQLFLDWFPSATSYANDAAAAAGGVQVGQAYRNGSQVMVRVV